MKLSKKLLIGSITTLGAIGVGATVVAPLANDATVAAPLADSIAQKNSSEVDVLKDTADSSKEVNNSVTEVTKPSEDVKADTVVTETAPSQDEKVDSVVTEIVTPEVEDVKADTVVDEVSVTELIKDATAPKDGTEIESYVLTDPVTNNEELNKFLKDNFDNLVKPTFKGYFENVEVSYKDNSADFNKKTFKINIKPISGHGWEDGSGNKEKEMSVYLSNMSWSAKIEIDSNKSVAYEVSKMGFTSANHLNTYLRSNFSSSNLKNIKFTNVDQIQYVEGSAKLAASGSSQFTIKVTPKAGAIWNKNEGYQSKTINVLFASAVPVTSVSSSDKFNYRLSIADVWNNDSFGSKLTELFRKPNNVKSNLIGDYSNVNLKFVSGSANYEKGEFKLAATPINGFQWSDFTSGDKIITVNANNIQRFNTVLPVKVGNSFSSLVKLTPAPSIVVTGKTKDHTAYEAKFTINTYAAEFGWYSVWRYSKDGGKTWSATTNIGKTKTFNLSSWKVPKGSLVKFQIMGKTYYTGPAVEAYAMTFNAV
ncbi:hypothetical protein D8X55_00820 [Malacoplasma penetrans]|uniref:hypothetical protein n=1 Tax=Malacoplasma penetrans TaxID=28227 RepID=UPI0010134002|nr:hypothetical protein [Malacoplasma penetrans]RXY97228.1 hypothetical protein D8X55_00820 [Malacoplasma penetrans]